MRARARAAGIVLAAATRACTGARPGAGDDHVYTLVRSSATDSDPLLAANRPAGQAPLRIHVATFDAADGDAYNAENCETARALFMGQPGVTVRYWCEKGRFRR